jgi:hypothetical protein
LIYELGRSRVQRKKMGTYLLKGFLCEVNRRSEKETGKNEGRNKIK